MNNEGLTPSTATYQCRLISGAAKAKGLHPGVEGTGMLRGKSESAEKE